MHHRVLLAGAPAEVLQNRADIGTRQHLRQLVNCPGNALVQIGTGDGVEQFAQERIGFRQRTGRDLTREATSRNIAAGGKQPVGEGLRIHVGKLLAG